MYHSTINPIGNPKRGLYDKLCFQFYRSQKLPMEVPFYVTYQGIVSLSDGDKTWDNYADIWVNDFEVVDLDITVLYR